MNESSIKWIKKPIQMDEFSHYVHEFSVYDEIDTSIILVGKVVLVKIEFILTYLEGPRTLKASTIIYCSLFIQIILGPGNS